LVYFNLLISN